MSTRSLQDDLLEIPGVEGAEVEGSGDAPAGLRIRIAEGADQQAVGGAIRRVLTAHGLGTDTRLPGEPGESIDPDVADAGQASQPVTEESSSVDLEAASVAVLEDEENVIDLTDDAGESAENTPDAESHDAGESGENTPDAESHDDGGDEMEVEESAADVPPQPPAERKRSTAPVPSTDIAIARIASVAVAEGRDGIVVTVAATDGTKVEQPAASTEGGVESAVVKATARLARPGAPDAVVVEIEDRRVEGIDIVMIVLDSDGHMVAGSSVVGAGRSFALGRATWAALSL